VSALISIVGLSSASSQETLVGIVGQDFVVLGADSSASSSIALTSTSQDKIHLVSDPLPLGPPNAERKDGIGKSGSKLTDETEARARALRQQAIAVAAVGDSADVDRLVSVLAAHCAVREYESGIGCDVEVVYDGQGRMNSVMSAFPSPAALDAAAVAHLARGEIASSLRSGGGRLKMSLLVAGMVRRSERSGTNGSFLAGTEGIWKDDDPTFSGRVRRQVKAAAEEYRRSQGKQQTESIEEASAFSLPKNSRESTAAGEKEQIIEQGEKAQSFLIPRLFWLDEYGSIQNLEYGAHGLGANFALSILDRGYQPDITKEKAIDLIRNCFDQLRTRYLINSPQPPVIKCIDEHGCLLVQ